MPPISSATKAVALIVLVTTFLAIVLQVALLRGPIGLAWGSVLQSIWPATATTAVMAAAVFATRVLIGDLGSSLIRLVVLVAVGAAIYVAFGLLAFRPVFTSARGDIRTMIVGGRVRHGGVGDWGARDA